MGMTSETQGILHKISALRQRLEQARSQAQDEGGSAVASLTEHEAPGLARLWELEHQATAETDHRRQLDAVVKPASPTERSMPSQLTGRARRAIEKGRTLYGKFFCSDCHSPEADGSGAWVLDGAIPDLRYMPPAIHQQWNAILLNGTRRRNGRSG